MMVGWIGRALSQISGSVDVGNAQSNEVIAKTLEQEVSRLFPSRIYPTNEAFDYAVDLAVEIKSEFDLPDSPTLINAVIECIEQLVISNAILPPKIHWDNVDHEGYEGHMLRLYLERHKQFHANHRVNKKRFEQGVFFALFEYLPHMSLGEDYAKGVWGFVE